MAYKEPKFDSNGIKALNSALNVRVGGGKKSSKKSATSKKKK